MTYPRMEENPRLGDEQKWINWCLGFTIYDRDDGEIPKHFLAKLDAVTGKVRELTPLPSIYQGEQRIKIFYKEIYIPIEKYLEVKRRGH